MGMVSSTGLVETDTKVATLMIKEKATVRCTGLMDLFTKATGSRAFNRV